jgi:hypothetical protein
MQSSNGNFGSVNSLVPALVKGRGIAHRKLSHKQRVALAAGVWTGAVHVTQHSMPQTLAVVSGVTAREIYLWVKRRNNGNGNSGITTAPLAPPSPAVLTAMAAELVKTVGLDAAFDLVVAASNRNGG